jgi:hypothetical protein
LDKQREEIVNGTRDPTPEELSKLEELKKPTEEKGEAEIDVEELKKTKGVPGFWLKAFQNDPEIETHIKEHDVPILKHITNIREELLGESVIRLSIIIFRTIASFSPSLLTSSSRTQN